MKYPVKYTYLGFYLNLLVDSGEFISLSEIKKEIEKKNVLNFIESKYPDRFDISLYTKEELEALEEYFCSLNDIMDESRKMGIEKNGLCLLVAYCFQALQRDPESI
ncbi:hypothetical protein BAX97_08005 [Elizabethkingia meningoseptica]|uniref:hypothetical protein n=1 Tax=Elizabethkingia meningoseptica TaxID=238 RepID=UPI000999BFCE|nr:hypothetical protein [Elizabethkingia meningoseptica]OPC27869.1 hypothetical protein BAX97_08005 [Elizabethkingia meningoseptica]